MATERFAKLFEIEGSQVLFWVEPDGDEEIMHQQVMVTELGLVDIAIRIVTANEKTSTAKWLADLSEKDAHLVLKAVLDLAA